MHHHQPHDVEAIRHDLEERPTFLGPLKTIPRILGFIEDGNGVTLDICFPTGASLSSVSKATFEPQLAFFDVHFDRIVNSSFACRLETARDQI
jgi:hypothetical protein